MKKQLQRPEPKIVARYGKDYAITQGVTNGMYYGFYKKEFLGHNEALSYVISLISIRESVQFDINKVEVL
ncbi:MAG: hypothetical protein Q8M43_01255 [Sulfuricurvum sp.]|uniref:hypothetical protein n=1 Tax=Sulfuricurvum sp. TaxID=2025608 RepID=UPI0027344FE0|nr:hypothetical protein [Sulfuricurvum sp.]MDP3290639.1 hypothetical protein [Sulfuricurvum sp.]